MTLNPMMLFLSLASVAVYKRKPTDVTLNKKKEKNAI